MLNELLTLEQGVRKGGLITTPRHPDVKDAGGGPTLIVGLDDDGKVATVRPLPSSATPWTLRDGQQNSFPFLRWKYKLSCPSQQEDSRQDVLDKPKESRREAVLAFSRSLSLEDCVETKWPSKKFLSRVAERREELKDLENTEAEVVPATFDRFLKACELVKRRNGQTLLTAILSSVVANIEATPQAEWIELAIALLVGEKKNGIWECNPALLFEAEGCRKSILAPELILAVSSVLNQGTSGEADRSATSICGLTGNTCRLLQGNFPQPKLPLIGQTFLFAKNPATRANDRYGKSGGEAMAVGHDTIVRLGGALSAITSIERRNICWRGIPGEKPKQTDLLVAYVEGIPDAEVALVVAEEDFAEELGDSSSDAVSSVARFEELAGRLLRLVKGRISCDVREVSVRLMVFRKLDPANRKIVFSGCTTVPELYEAALSWARGERNVPSWLSLPVFQKGTKKPLQTPPTHVAPLGLTAFSRLLYFRDGEEHSELNGLAAKDVLALFLQGGDASKAGRSRASTVMRHVLRRRGPLVLGTAHTLHKGLDASRLGDCREVLRTITVFGILLEKLGRSKEVYMNDAAFKLGQLLASADVVHAGYCADVRGGSVPPSLLGNQVFGMAQTNPTKALAVLCRRWKPYDGWARKTDRERNRIDSLTAEDRGKGDNQRGWDVKKALRSARGMRSLASELASILDGCRVDDAFRAELLLGYLAGVPKPDKSKGTTEALESKD